MEVHDAPKLSKYIEGIVKQRIERPAGIHVSDLTSCITRSYWNKKSESQAADDATLMRWFIGVAVEEKLSLGKTQIPKLVDNIWASPDLELPTMFVEIKTTRVSIVEDGLKYGWPLEWIRRMMTYCWIHEKLEWYLVVVGLIQAKMLVKKFSWTREELYDFWTQFILVRRNVLQQAVTESIPPEPFAWNESWECEGCQYKLICTGVKQYGEYIKRGDETL